MVKNSSLKFVLSLFFYLMYYLNSQRLAIFYIRLGGIHFIQIHHEGGS